MARFWLLISNILIYCSVTDVKKKLQEYVDDINENIEKLDTRGPVSKYVLPDENLRGRYAFFVALTLEVRTTLFS